MKAGTLEIELITNVARLQKEMADMKRSVAGAMGDITESASRADKALGSAGGGGLTRMGGSAKLAGHQVQNLVYQLNDMVVGLFSGQKPMTVFMQQGTQIGQIGMQAGMGIGGMARALVGLAASSAAAALTNPYLLAAAAAAALAFGAFKMFQSSVKQTGELDKYAQSLGLTKKEMEKLGPVGITVGDTMKGLWKTVSDGLSLGSVFSTLKDWAATAFEAIMQVGKYAIAFIYAGWVGGFGAIKILWSSLPGVIGEAVVGAANLAISGVEFMANKAIAAINWLVDRVNPLLDRVGLTTISRVESVALPRMENSFAGSTARMAGQIQSEFSTAFGDAMSMMDSFSAKWRENTIAAAKARLAAKAEEIRGDKADKTAKGPKTTEAEKALKAAQDFARNLELETAKIGKTPIEIKRMEVAMAALKAPTDEARIAILQAGEAWEKATKAQAEKEFIRNTVAPLELQVAMLGKSTKAQELANLEAEKEQIVLERGAAAWERYRAAKTALIEHDFQVKEQEQFLQSLEDMVSATQAAASNMADAFGSVGGAKFFGISVGSSYSTQYAAASAELEQQFSLIFSGFYDAISAAAGPLGMSLDEVQSRLAGFVVNIGKIDLKGLTGEQIQEKLTAVFGAAADSIARAAIPGLEQFQKVGEGYFETLVRVASSIEAVTSSLSLLGTSVEGLSLSAKMNLFDLFGSASDMASATSDYFSLFYTKAEQTAALTAQMTQVFGSLGLTLPDSIAGFRALVDAQDLTTEAGRAAYVALIQLAPAFADLIGAAQDAASAAAIVDERLGLERQLLELQGNTAALRALDLAQLDESNRALQEQIWALQDQQKAADEAAAAAEKLRSAWTQITDGLLAEVARIRGSMDGGTKTYAQALSEFNAATLAARSGDQEAAKSLPGLSQTLLNAAADAATSAQDLARIQGQTAASLEQTVAIINAMAGLPAETAAAAASTNPSWWEQFASTQTATATTSANDSATVLIDGLASLKQELSDLRDEQRIASATIASGTSKTARILERVTPDGDALAVRTAA